MVVYTCDVCNHDFNKKSNYNSHLARKRPCKPVIKESTPNHNLNNKSSKNIPNIPLHSKNGISKHICDYCNRSYKYNYNLNRHHKTCKSKKIYDIQDINEKFEIMQNQIDELKEENKKLKKKKGKNKIINSNNNINNTINNNNITLVAFGKEDINNIDQSQIIEALNKEDPIKALTEAVHFNTKHPEFMNVYVSNIKDKFVNIFNGNTWVKKFKPNVVDNMYDMKIQYLEYLDECTDFFFNKIKKLPSMKIKGILKEDVDDPDDIQYILNRKKELELSLYNNRNMVLTYKQITL